MHRPFLGGQVRQNHQTEYLNLNDLQEQVNDYYRKQGKVKAPRDFSDFFNRKEWASLFMESLSREIGVPIKDLKHVKRGKFGGTYVHPILFLKIAGWLMPALEAKIYVWFYDSLCHYRDLSGESFKEMCSALWKNLGIKDPLDFRRISNYIADSCGVANIGRLDGNRWDHATPDQLLLRDRVHRNIALLSSASKDLVFIMNTAIERAKEDVAREKGISEGAKVLSLRR